MPECLCTYADQVIKSAPHIIMVKHIDCPEHGGLLKKVRPSQLEKERREDILEQSKKRHPSTPKEKDS